MIRRPPRSTLFPYHDALPILRREQGTAADAGGVRAGPRAHGHRVRGRGHAEDRKSTRLNSSHANISYAVFCLKKNIAPNPRPSLVPMSRALLDLPSPLLQADH